MKKSRKIKRKNLFRTKQIVKRKSNKRKTKKRKTKKRINKKYKQRGGMYYVLCDYSTVNPADGSKLDDRICIYRPLEKSQCCDSSGKKIPIYHFDSSNNTFKIDQTHPSGFETASDGVYDFTYVVRSSEPNRIYYQLSEYAFDKVTGHEMFTCGTSDKRSINHPCVGDGENAICAGHIFIKPDEKKITINRHSGHYGTGDDNLKIVGNILRSNLEDWDIIEEDLTFTPGMLIWLKETHPQVYFKLFGNPLITDLESLSVVTGEDIKYLLDYEDDELKRGMEGESVGSIVKTKIMEEINKLREEREK